MNNFTYLQKKALETECENGKQVSEVAYDPAILTLGDDPEGDAIAAGWQEYYREDSMNLVEVIYTK